MVLEAVSAKVTSDTPWSLLETYVCFGSDPDEADNTEKDDSVLMTIELLIIAEVDPVAVVSLGLVETNWEAAESDFKVAMINVDSVKVGCILSDVIFLAENDVLIIDAVNVNDVDVFCSNVDVLDPLLL